MQLWRAVVAAQEAVAAQVLRQCGTRARFRELFSRLYNYPKYGLPVQHGEPGGVLRRVGPRSCPTHLCGTCGMNWFALSLLFGWTRMHECRKGCAEGKQKANNQQGPLCQLYCRGMLTHSRRARVVYKM